MTGNFKDDSHALYVGWILGHAMRAGVPALPVMDDEGNYTDRITVPVSAFLTITVIVPPPPDDWTPHD